MSETKCNNVEKTEKYNFGIKLIQHGSGYNAEWSSNYPVAPDWGTLSLRLGTKEKASHKTGTQSGKKEPILSEWGAGYVLTYFGRSFPPVKDLDFVVTPATTGAGGTVEGSADFYYTVWLGMNEHNNARVTWRTDLQVRPKQSLIRVFHKEKILLEEWVETSEGFIDTEVRWGVDLSAALIGEDFAGNKHDLVRTPRTRRS